MPCRASLRRVARNLQCGGVFWRLETTSNDIDLDFDRDSIELNRFLSPNIGDLLQKKRYPQKLGLFFGPNLRDLKKKKKKEEKKVFSQAETRFLFEITSDPWPIIIANTTREGGAIFVFSAKIGLKSAKNGMFCILFRPMGGYSPSPPPPLWLHYWRHYKKEGYERAVPFVTG